MLDSLVAFAQYVWMALADAVLALIIPTVFFVALALLVFFALLFHEALRARGFHAGFKFRRIGANAACRAQRRGDVEQYHRIAAAGQRDHQRRRARAVPVERGGDRGLELSRRGSP